MNVILIMSDTFRRDYLGCYGNRWIRTPNLDKFAREATVFDRAYAASFPTVPNRHDIFTGRYTFTYSDWAPLPKDEIVLAQLLRQTGYVTQLIADTPHMMKDGFNYDRGFDCWLWIRGQEGERYMTAPEKVQLPCNPSKLRYGEGRMAQHLRNVSLRRFESDYFIAQTMTAATQWLELNYSQHKNFFLHIDAFDPHEPWDPPKYYVNMYDPNYEGEEVIYPVYGPCKYLSKEELKHVKALYAAEATMVDRWIGTLLGKVKDLGLLEDTAVIFTSDHGFYFGEHGLIGKSIISPGVVGWAPLYEEVSRVPLLIQLPDSVPHVHGERSEALVQSPDLMPTILEMAGANFPNGMHGVSIVPLLRGESPSNEREIAVTSPPILNGPVAGERITVTTREWALIYPGQIEEALRDIGAKGDSVNFPGVGAIKSVSSIKRLRERLGSDLKPELYHLPSDPNQSINVSEAEREVAEELHLKLVKFLESIGAKEEILRYWRRLQWAI